MEKVGKRFYKVLEESLLELGQGKDIEIILARYPRHSVKLRPYLENIIQMRTPSTVDEFGALDIEPQLSFTAVLNDCIGLLKRGEPIEVCYALYPKHEKQLAPWLSTFLDLKKNGSLGTIINLERPVEDGSAPLSFLQALEDCLLEMAKGANPDDVLLRHPYYIERLRPWIYFQARLDRQIGLAGKSSIPISQPSIQPKRKVSRNRIYSYIPSAKNVIWTLLIAAYSLFSINGLVHAAQGTLPGDSLYPVKITYEAAQLFLANPDIKGELGEYFDAERRSETIALINSRRIERVEFIGELNVLDGRVWFVSEVPVIFTNVEVQAKNIKDGTKVHIYGYTAPNGVIVSAIEEVVLPDTSAVASVGNSSTPFASTQLLTATQIVAQPSLTPASIFAAVVPSATDKPAASAGSFPISGTTDIPTATLVPTSVPPTKTLVPTSAPTYTLVPTAIPTEEPTETLAPTVVPTKPPTQTPVPTVEPTEEPTQVPTVEPTEQPTLVPTTEPTDIPTQVPAPTSVPTDEPLSFIPPLPAPTEIAMAAGQ